MTQPALTIDLVRDRCPVHPVTVRLPLATISELDARARASHLTRGQLLSQLIEAALAHDTPRSIDIVALHGLPFAPNASGP